MKPPSQLPLTPADPLVEYTAAGEKWRCCRFDLVTTEFELTDPALLPRFHAVLSERPRGWKFACRLFGLHPAFPLPGTSPDDLRVWTRKELLDAEGLTRGQLQEEMKVLIALWRGVAPRLERKNLPDAPAPVTSGSSTAAAELIVDKDPLLIEHGFEGMRFKSVSEQAIFVARLRDLQKVLREARAAGLVRRFLITELELARLDEYISSEQCAVGGRNWMEATEQRTKMTASYQQLVANLEKLCPWEEKLGGKYSMTSAIADITRAIQEASLGRTALVDGIYEATEIQVLCRRSVQSPEPRYRAGHIMYLHEARAGFWDPNHQSKIPHRMLKMATEGWRAAAKAVGDAEGEPVPDLTDRSPAGEYPAVIVPPAPPA